MEHKEPKTTGSYLKIKRRTSILRAAKEKSYSDSPKGSKPNKKNKEAQTKLSPLHSDFAKGEERQPAKNPVLSFGPKSGEAEHGEKKRRLFEQSEFLRFRRAKLRSRSETADGGFSFCYLFLFAAKKKK